MRVGTVEHRTEFRDPLAGMTLSGRETVDGGFDNFVTGARERRWSSGGPAEEV
jgi:hypothetical protein